MNEVIDVINNSNLDTNVEETINERVDPIEEQVNELSQEISQLNIEQEINDKVNPLQEQVNQINTEYQEADEEIIDMVNTVSNNLRQNMMNLGMTDLTRLREYEEWLLYPIENDISDIIVSSDELSYIYFMNDILVIIRYDNQTVTAYFPYGTFMKFQNINVYVFPDDHGNDANCMKVFNINYNNIRLGGNQTTVEGKMYNLLTNECTEIQSVFTRNNALVSPKNISVYGRRATHLTPQN